MEEIIFVGALIKEKKETEREDMTNFRKTNRPPKDNFMLF